MNAAAWRCPRVTAALPSSLCSWKVPSARVMNADAFAGAALERTFDRPRAAADYRFVLPGPVKDALGAGIVGDHPLIIVIGMMRQRFDGGAVA